MRPECRRIEPEPLRVLLHNRGDVPTGQTFGAEPLRVFIPHPAEHRARGDARGVEPRPQGRDRTGYLALGNGNRGARTLLVGLRFADANEQAPPYRLTRGAHRTG